MITVRSWALSGVALTALLLTSCAEQLNQLKARQAFKDANVAYSSKNYGKAIDDYSRAIELDPEGKSGVLLHSLFYVGSSHHLLFRPAKEDDAVNLEHRDKAIEYYEKTLQRDPTYRSAIEQLAGLYRDNLDDFENSEKYFRMIIDLEPNKAENWYSLAALYERFHDPDTRPLIDKALEAYQKPIELSPNDPATYRQVAAFINKYPTPTSFDQTMEWLAKARDVQPDNPEGYYVMATYYWDKVYRDPALNAKQRKDYITKGQEQVRRAVELKSDYTDALIYTGLLLREESKLETNAKKKQALLDEAKKFQDKAIEIRKGQQQAQATTPTGEAPSQPPARNNE